jgi:hypothetical protein
MLHEKKIEISVAPDIEIVAALVERAMRQRWR